MQPQRKYPRLQGHDYNGGDYFVTVCCHNRQCLLGNINGDKMYLSPVGNLLDEAMCTISLHIPDIIIPEYVIMPNHFHAIISVVGSQHAATAHTPLSIGRLNQTARLVLATGGDPTEQLHFNSRLSIAVGSIKSAVSRQARNLGINFKWQSRFYEHIIRNHQDGNRISDYINHNVSRWAEDCFYVEKSMSINP